ncbi:hypothetical protein L6452_25901 [Arctium lappa]|uniref:Uncharacterized protein n=1 Tax=Arctium lappa TaxID=4217 RepID=A0ACB9AB26_ARCLA|nr:hypothetical protein L6452_25901 [Arctium lappa]
MASSISSISEELGELDGRITDVFRALSNGFQKLEKIKDSGRQSRQLAELTDKMRECKRLIKEFEREVKDLDYSSIPHASKTLNERKQSMVKELNSYVELKKKYASNIERKRVGHIEGTEEVSAEDNGLLASSMTNQELVDHGNQMMDETDQAIERSKKVVHDTVNVGTETAATLKGQTEQMNRIIDDLDSIHFSIKKASRLVKELGRQVVTDRCIMSMLFLIVIGVIAIIIVKVEKTSAMSNWSRFYSTTQTYWKWRWSQCYTQDGEKDPVLSLGSDTHDICCTSLPLLSTRLQFEPLSYHSLDGDSDAAGKDVGSPSDSDVIAEDGSEEDVGTGDASYDIDVVAEEDEDVAVGGCCCVMHLENQDIQDIPGLAPPAVSRKLLWFHTM